MTEILHLFGRASWQGCIKALLVVWLVPFIPVEADALLQDAGSEGGTYRLDVDGNWFDVPYAVDADVIAMVVDQELYSVLVAINNTRGPVMNIGLEHDLLYAQDGAYAVLVDGIEVDYTLDASGYIPILSFPVHEHAEEVEIIGTSVVPEFSHATLALLAAVASVAAASSWAGRRLP